MTRKPKKPRAKKENTFVDKLTRMHASCPLPHRWDVACKRCTLRIFSMHVDDDLIWFEQAIDSEPC